MQNFTGHVFQIAISFIVKGGGLKMILGQALSPPFFIEPLDFDLEWSLSRIIKELSPFFVIQLTKFKIPYQKFFARNEIKELLLLFLLFLFF